MRQADSANLPREDAKRDCLPPIASALEDGGPQDYDTGAETVTFNVIEAPAA